MPIKALFLIGVLLVTACAVMPAETEKKAVDLPFPDLIAQADRYEGKTVILGGYILEVENQKEQTRLVLLQAPLGFGQEPKSKDLSMGRIIVHYKGFLDPEVYEKNRKVTVAGTLLGSSATDQTQQKFPYVTLAATHIYLWPKEQPMPVYPRSYYWDYWGYPYPYDPWGFPYFYRPYPYHRR